MSKFLVILLVSIAVVSNGQSYSSKIEDILAIKDYTQVVFCLEELLDDVEIVEHQDTMSQVYHLIGKYYNRLENYAASIHAYKESINVRDGLMAQNRTDLYRIQYLLSRVYIRNGNETEGIELLDKIVASNASSEYGLLSLIQLGELAIHNEQYGYALQVFMRCRYINGIDDPYFLNRNIIQSISVVYYELGEFELAIQNLSSIISDKNIWNYLDAYDKALIYEELAFNHMSLDHLKEALRYFEQAYSHYFQDSPDNHEDFIRNLSNQSIVYFEQENFERSVSILSKVLDIHLVHGNEKHIIGDAYCNLSESYNQLGLIDSAMLYSNYAIAKWTKSEQVNLNYESLKDAYDLSELVIHLRDRVSFDSSICQVDSYLLIDSLVTGIFARQYSVSASEYWVEFASDMYDEAVDHALKCNAIEEALFFSEKSKGLLIYSMRRQSQALNLEDEVKAELLALEQSIAELERELFVEENIELEIELLSEKDRHHNILEKYYTQNGFSKFPFYSKDVFEYGGEDAIVSYHLTENRLHTFVLSNQNPVQVISANIDSFDMLVSLYDSLICNVSHEGWEDVSRELYSQLITDKVDPGNDELVIIPDKRFGNLSFASLLSPQNMFLVEDYNISYYFSVLSYIDHIEKSPISNSTKTIYKMASNSADLFYTKKDLAQLPYFEVEDLYSSAQLNAKLDKEDVSILHFASHAFTNDTLAQFSYLDMGTDRIYINDLFGLQWNNDFTFLGACSTGQDRSQSSLHLSLGLGVAAAGSENHIQTLWNINDSSSSIIINEFYNQLSTGIPYKKSLNNAQLDFLKTCPQAWRHPYYWASFQYFGRPQSHIKLPWYKRWFG